MCNAQSGAYQYCIFGYHEHLCEKLETLKSVRKQCRPNGSMDRIVLLCSVLAFLLYLNTLDADFAYDDCRAIKTNPDVQPSTPLSQIFVDDFWGTPLTHSGSHKSYRPLTVLSFRLNVLLHDLKPFGFHLVNILLHTAATALFTKFARTIFRQTFPCAISGAIFASHPIHTEAVAGVVGRADIGSSIFFLLAFLAYRKYLIFRTISIHGSGTHPKLKSESPSCSGRSTPSIYGDGSQIPPSVLVKKYLFLGCTICCALFSMLTKEHGVTILAVCYVYDVFIHSRVRSISDFIQKFSKSLMEPTLVVALAVSSLIGGRLLIMGTKPPEFSPSDNPASDSDSIITRTCTFLYLPVFNFWLLLNPSLLSFDWSMESIPTVNSIYDPRNYLTLVFYCSLAYFMKKLCEKLGERRKSPFRITYDLEKLNISVNYFYDGVDIAVICLLIVIVPFIPASNLFFYVGFVVAERILYIPSMGFCLMIGYGCDLLRKWSRSETKKNLLLSAIILLISVFCARTVTRNIDWSNEEKLYRAGIAVNPPKAYGNLANIFSAQGKKSEAEWAYKKALSYRTNMADVHYNLGILYQELKRYDEAITSYKNAINYRPRMAVAHLNLGLVYALLGKKEEAVEVYLKCSKLDGSGLKDPRTHESTKISALFNLGRLYADEGLYHKAIEVYSDAIHKMPSHYQPQSLYNMLGEAYFKLDQLEEAEYWYKEALRVKPDHIPAHLTYAKLLARQSKSVEAEEWFIKVRELAPSDSTVYHHYGQFLSETDRHPEAAELYIIAAQLAPSEYETVFNAANTLRQAGRNKEAEHFYRQAVQLRPNVSFPIFVYQDSGVEFPP
ncbi:hypothetical protein QYM36_010897 [Artemia franciscana]|uniref:dolichyl-phosphate-mannose--protein mannosyltransferase n=1 Tax=Artemia franciscana TaxID=6661 RepID=A0AA88L8G5_ARTSF|nr:hypothetical protein QYM36_010897 [Artemia franciscana]